MFEREAIGKKVQALTKEQIAEILFPSAEFGKDYLTEKSAYSLIKEIRRRKPDYQVLASYAIYDISEEVLNDLDFLLREYLYRCDEKYVDILSGGDDHIAPPAKIKRAARVRSFPPAKK